MGKLGDERAKRWNRAPMPMATDGLSRDDAISRVLAAAETMAAQRVVLFGSGAESEKARDWDFLIVASSVKHTPYLDRIERAALRAPQLDVRILTPTEFDALHPVGSRFRTDVDSGIVLR